MISPSEWLTIFPRSRALDPDASTWGHKGYGEVWLNGSNDWVYRHQHRAEERMVELARLRRGAKGAMRRALGQAARELLLLQSSDWAFLLHAGTAAAYARRRVEDHVARFALLADGLERGKVAARALRDIESRDTLFGEIDASVYA